MKTMSLIVLIALSILLLVSIGANGFLVYKNGQQSKAADQAATQAASQASSLRQDASALRLNLATATAGIRTAVARADTLADSVATLTADRQKMSTDRDNILRQLERTMCHYTIPSSSLAGVTTNSALVEPITNATEQNYGFISIGTTYQTLWKNSESAVFDVMDQDRATVKVIVSWDQNKSRINGIFDVGGACYLYVH